MEFMTQEDITKLRDWLAGPRDFTEGASLYRRYGCNLMLKRQFAVDRSPIAMAVLEDEIRKLAGLSEQQLAHLPRIAKKVDNSGNSKDSENSDTRKPISAEGQKKIRFREKYPFLSASDCPDVLKVLVADMFTAYGKARESFASLQTFPEDKADNDSRLLCVDVVENYLENRLIFDELEHYRVHKTLLGVHPKVKEAMGVADGEPDYMGMDTAELVKKLNSANANVSKARKAVKTATTDARRSDAEDRLEKWTARLESIRAAVELRKKN